MNEPHPCAADWLALTDYGFSIFPLTPEQKTPAQSWTPYQTRRATDDELNRWLHTGTCYNVAVATGAVSGVVVLDLDSPEAEAFAKGQGLPATPEVKTPRGRHLYFRHPGAPMSNSAGKIANQIDFRGDGGYVVGPGSYFVPTAQQAADGKVEGAYDWVEGRTPADLSFAALPAWAIPVPPPTPAPQPVNQPLMASSRILGSDNTRQAAYASTTLAGICDTIAQAPSGTRNDTLNAMAYKAAAYVGGGVLDEWTARQAVEDAAQLAGLPKSEAKATINSAWERGKADPKFMANDSTVKLTPPVSTSKPTSVETLIWRSAADACAAPLVERQWLIDQWLPVGATTLLTGDGGMGKSLVAQQMAAAVAAGKPLWGHAIIKAPVLALYCEDDDHELDRRQQSINASMRLDGSDLIACQWGSRFGQSSLLGHIDRTGAFITNGLFDAIHSAALSHGARLVILDNINMVFGDNINDPGAVTRFMAALNGLALSINGAVLLLGHIAKGEGSRFAGTAAWSNVARNRLFLCKPDNGGEAARNPDLRHLTRDKSNYARTGDKLDLMWERGAFITAADTGEGRTLEQVADDKRFLTSLDYHTSNQTALSISPQASNYAPKVMTHRNGYADAKQRRAMVEAMGRLLTDGTILDDEPLGWKKNKRDATGIKRADTDPATMVASSTMDVLDALTGKRSADPIVLSEPRPAAAIVHPVIAPAMRDRSSDVAAMMAKMAERRGIQT